MKLYVIKCKGEKGIEWLITVNGSPARETENGVGEFVSASKSLILGVIPLLNSKKCIYLPMYRRTGENLPDCREYAFGENAAYVCIDAPFIYKDASPYILSRCGIPGSELSALVYYDKGANFIIENRQRAVAASVTLPFVPECAEMEPLLFGQESMVLLKMSFEGEQYAMLYSCRESKQVYFHSVYGTELMPQGPVFTEKTGDPLGMAVKRSFTGSVLTKSEYVDSGIKEKSDLLSLSVSFITAVKHRAESYAMSLLSPELKNELSFADICAFFGEPGEYIPELSSLSAKASVALMYGDRIKKYDFSGNSLITDIDEVF